MNTFLSVVVSIVVFIGILLLIDFVWQKIAQKNSKEERKNDDFFEQIKRHNSNENLRIAKRNTNKILLRAMGMKEEDIEEVLDAMEKNEMKKNEKDDNDDNDDNENDEDNDDNDDAEDKVI